MGVNAFMSLSLFLWEMWGDPNNPTLMLAANCCTLPWSPTLIQPFRARTPALGAFISLLRWQALQGPWTLPQS